MINMTDKHIVPTWFLLFGLLLGVVASVVGYIGCFSVVQSAQKSTGPLSWLCLEAALSLLRIHIWSLNPQSDDAPPLEFILALDNDPPLPTCNKYDGHLDEDKVLPLTRAGQFLNSVTSFAGLIDRFDHPDLTLYYALTRKQAPVTETTPGERVLYIAVFDHKERTTRVYTRGDSTNRFHAIESSIPVIDLEHGIVETTLGRMIDSKTDPIVGVDGIRNLLEEHYQSIMDPYSAIGNTSEDHRYRIENRWTMKRADTTSAPQQDRKPRIATSTVTPGQHTNVCDTDRSSGRDLQYLELGRIERMMGSFYTRRGKWIESYMALVISETRERFVGAKTIVRRGDGDAVADTGKADETQRTTGGAERLASESDPNQDLELLESLLIEEWCLSEKLMVYEVERWEEQLWERAKAFIESDEVSEKERLANEWRANSWKRLDANIRAMDARMDAAKANAKFGDRTGSERQSVLDGRYRSIQQAWQSVLEEFVGSQTPSVPPSMPLPCSEHENLPAWWRENVNETQRRRLARQMENRFTIEIEDVTDRLKQGLERCNDYWIDQTLVECRHSRSKVLTVDTLRWIPGRLEVLYRELKRNKNVIYLHFQVKYDAGYLWVADVIRDMPWVTTIFVEDAERLPDIQRDTPLCINDIHTQYIDFQTFLDDNPRLARSQDTLVFFYFTPTIAVSFVGPESGNLVLKLIHSSVGGAYLTVKGTSFRLAIPHSFAVDYITLYAHPSEPGHLSFERGTRNNLIIQVIHDNAPYDYDIHDIQLLDEAGSRDDLSSRSHHDVIVEEATCVSCSLIIHCNC